MFKKFLAVALSATMALSFVGCGSSKDKVPRWNNLIVNYKD